MLSSQEGTKKELQLCGACAAAWRACKPNPVAFQIIQDDVKVKIAIELSVHFQMMSGRFAEIFQNKIRGIH